MAYITNYQYYLNGGVAPLSINHGSGQHISITDIINSYMLMFVGPDKIVDNVGVHEVRFHAKQGVKRMNYDSVRSINALEFTIGADLNLVMPPDYVNYVRISREQDGVLFPLTENRSAMSADAYLTDNAGELLFDSDGEVLVGTSKLDLMRVSSTSGELLTNNGCCYYPFYSNNHLGINPSNANINPKFSINQNAGVINFDSGMLNQLVVLEYISDGMSNGNDANIVVHKFFEEYIYSHITYSILDAKYGIAANKIQEAKKKRGAAWNNASIRIMNLNPAELLMTLRGQNKWIK